MIKGKQSCIHVVIVLLLCFSTILFSGCTEDGDVEPVNDTNGIDPDEEFEVSLMVAEGQEEMIDALIGAGWYNENDFVSVEAVAADGYRFVEWTGDFNSPNNPATFRMPATHVHLTASFEVDPSGDNNDNNDFPVKTRLMNVSVQIADLPSGYFMFTEDETLAAQFGFVPVGNVSDVYGVTFLHNQSTEVPNTPMILASLVHADTIEDGSKLINASYLALEEELGILFNKSPMKMNVNIGNQTQGMIFYGELRNTADLDLIGELAVWTILYVRVDTIVLFLSLQEIPPGDMDYQQRTIEYMHVMVDRLNDVLNS